MMFSVVNLIERLISEPWLLVLPVIAWHSPYRKEAGMIFVALLMYGFF
jgi:hypothetical protein